MFCWFFACFVISIGFDMRKHNVTLFPFRQSSPGDIAAEPRSGNSFSSVPLSSPLVSPSADFGAGESLLEVLDMAQSQLDEAEKLFCAGFPDLAFRCVERATQILMGGSFE